MASSDLYKLCPLGPVAGLIRLLRLHPSLDPDKPLTATLYATSLDESKKTYEALSYCWGDETQRGSIFVNVQDGNETKKLQISITRSLAEAFADLRASSTDRVLWADAICINQTDNTEKSIQVRQMLQVYQSSSRTVAYLGRDTGGMQAATAHMDYLWAVEGKPRSYAEGIPAAWHPVEGLVHADKTSSLAVGSRTPFVTKARLPEPDLETSSPRNLVRGKDVLASPGDIEAAWIKWFSFPWFTRAWTTQEFVGASNVLLQLGPGAVTLTLLDMAILIFFLHEKKPVEHGTMLLDHILGCGGAMKMVQMLNLKIHRNLSIGEVYYRFEVSEKHTASPTIKAGDPRDRLWAILSLSGDRDEPMLQADYDLDVKDVYLRFSRHIISKGGTRHLIRAAPHTSLDMPSWGLTDGSWVPGQHLSHLQANGDRTALSERGTASEREPTLSPDGTQLGVPAVLADRLQWVGPQLPDYKATTIGSIVETYPILHAVIKAIDEAAAPTFFMLPSETPERAIIEFFRGITFHYNPRSEYNAVTGKARFNARWVSYLRPWLESTELALEVLDENGSFALHPASPQARDFSVLHHSPFFVKVRRDGWPSDMIKVTGYSLEAPSDDSEGSDKLLFLVLQRFLPVIWWHYGWRICGWQSRRVGKSEQGYLCNLDPRAQVGDYIALMQSTYTTILRKTEMGSFRIVGNAYVHRLQEGAELHGQLVEDIWLC